MTTEEPADAGSQDDRRVAEILEAWFLEEDSADAPTLDELCGGDSHLIARVQRLIEIDPLVQQRALRAESGGQTEDAGELAERVVGDFRVVGLLGRGGMGSVYLAEQESLGREVALKVMDEPLLQDARARTRFRREAEITAALEHANIVPIYAVGEDDGQAYIAMKRLSGPGLDDVEAPLPAREVARIGRDIARALDEAHLAGIIHRDVKPANIIFDADVPFIVDFGLARSQQDRTLTRPGAVPGTLAYMAPELLRGSPSYLDPRVDVYALGATLYELVAGTPPFSADTPETTYSMILFAEPARMALPGVSRDLETIVLRALEKDPARRFPTALEMAEDLSRFLEGEPILSKRSGPVDRLLKRIRRSPRVSAALGAAALVLVIVGALALRSNIDNRRAFQRSLGLAEQAVLNEDHGEAIRLLESLADGAPGHPRIEELLRKSRGHVALERLQDALLNRRLTVRADELQELMATVERERVHEAKPRITGLALTLAEWQLENEDAARSRLAELRAELGESRGFAALQHLIEGDDGWTLDDAPATSPDEHVLVALAMRLSGHSIHAQEAELNLAFAQDASHGRTSFALAMALADAGELGAARSLLQGLATQPDAPRAVWRNLARILVTAGQLELARHTLQEIPRADWTSSEAYLELDILSRENDWEAFAERLAEHRAEWPESAEIQRATAEDLGRVGDYDEALEILSAVRKGDADYMNRDLAAATTIRIRLAKHQSELGQGGANWVSMTDEEKGIWLNELEWFVEDAADLLGRMRYAPAKAQVYWQQGIAYLILDQFQPTKFAPRAFTALDRAATHSPNLLGPRLEFAHRLQGLLPRRPFEGVGREMAISRARTHIHDVLERRRRGDLELPDEVLRMFLTAEVTFAEAQGDPLALLTALTELLALTPPGEDEPLRAKLESLEEGPLGATWESLQEAFDAVLDAK